jgi:hypothetical protein
MKHFRHIAAAIVAGALKLHAAPDAAPQETAFFEAKVLPVLQQRCFECHSHEKKIKGGLSLDSRSGWEKGGDNGAAIVPGDLEKSLLIKAVRRVDADLEMPPKTKLPAEEVAILEQWVKDGAHDPRAGEMAKKKRVIDLEEGRKFWAFRPVADPMPPEVKDASWALDPLDRFVLAKLERAGVRPVADADRYTWLRRVSLDLTGLPPRPEEIAVFVKDNAPNAGEKVVDRLLASKAFGERWARHWLDLTGYADMIGTSNDVFAEHAWRYRDYVIQAFNADKPFDEFIREQIAGDLMPSTSTEDRVSKLVATGFLMLGDCEIVNPDKAKMEADHVDSQIIKIGEAFMGMTLGCARCHDHKFDPIGLDDYYGIAGILRSSPCTHKISNGVWSTLNTTDLPETPEQIAAREKLEAGVEPQIASLKAERAKLDNEKRAVTGELAKFENAGATETQVVSASANSERNITPPATEPAEAPAGKEALTKRLAEIDAKIKTVYYQTLHAEAFRSKVPKAFAMHDGEKAGDMPIYIRGNPYAPSTIVRRGALRVASWEVFPPIPAGQSGRRQLADWLADKRNPLTARVTVNRIWQKLFGEGLVRSVDYIGDRGERPSHPELLDHLATRFMREGWSQKKFIRSVVLSRAYRLSSANDERAAKIDPENRLFWRMNRQRLDAEALRDSMLAVSGELLRNGGGPALAMDQVENVGNLGGGKNSANPPSYAHKVPRPLEEFQRTIYLPVLRVGSAGSARIRDIFDFINPAQIGGQRPQTTVPTQALFLLDNEMLRRRAGVLAKDLITARHDRGARLDEIWLRVFNRPITAAEHDDAAAFLDKITPLLRSQPDSEVLAWQELCHSLLASNEFIYRL